MAEARKASAGLGVVLGKRGPADGDGERRRPQWVVSEARGMPVHGGQKAWR